VIKITIEYKQCKQCLEFVESISTRRLCKRCAERNIRDSINSINARKGKYYDKWVAGMQRSVDFPYKKKKKK